MTIAIERSLVVAKDQPKSQTFQNRDQGLGAKGGLDLARGRGATGVQGSSLKRYNSAQTIFC